VMIAAMQAVSPSNNRLEGTDQGKGAGRRRNKMVGSGGIAALPLLLALVACRPSVPSSPTPVSGARVRSATGLEAGSAWSRPAPESGTGVVYLELRGAPDMPDRLESLSFAGAARAEIHRTVRKGDLVGMEALPEGLVVPAGTRVSLEPGGLHVMLLDLAAPLEAGAVFTVTLHLAQAGDLDLSVPVRSLFP
jgi:copper(I)-binding protein